MSSRTNRLLKWLWLAAMVALVLLGVLRPALPGLARQHWVVLMMGVAAIAFLGQLVRVRRIEGEQFGALLVSVLPWVLMSLYLQPQRVASDGIFYYAPLRSLVVDGDLDFGNEYRVLGAQPGYFNPTETGRLPNNYSIGPALLWTPAFVIAHGVAHLGLYRPTGFGYSYFTAVATMTVLFGFLGVVWTYRLARAYAEPRAAFVAALFVWLGSFHLWYMVYEPSMSHAPAMASVAGFLLFAHRGVKGWRAFALAGAIGGVVMLMRWQNGVYLPVVFLVSWAKLGRPRVQEIGAFASSALLVFFPQALYWNVLYGSFFLVPQGGGYVQWLSPQFEAVLFSARHGLLSWSPIVLLGLLGFPGVVRRAPALAVGLALSGFLSLYVNACVQDWWAGASFGSRRFDGLLPAVVLGLSVVLEWLVAKARRYPWVTVTAVVAPLLVWNWLLMGVYFGGAIPPDGPHSWRTAASDGIELLYRRLGYPFSWPASLATSLGTGRPASSYDLSGSQVRFNNVDIRMGDTDGLFLGRGWSLPQRRRDRTWRRGSPGGAELFVSLREPVPYRIEAVVRSEALIDVWLNGRNVGALSEEGDETASLSVPASDVREGINEIVLRSPERFSVARVQLLRAGDP